jgi:TolB-like protein/DNA-binding winged helix-turn-helix (wHTH) protein/Tfp pilus assembly protein PilF
MIYRFDRFQIDDMDFRLRAVDEAIPLEPKALRLLLYLVQNPNRLLRKRDILNAVWDEANVSESVLTRSVGLLRKALNDDSRQPRFIETVPTAGYRFIAEVTTVVETPSPATANHQGVMETPASANLQPRRLVWALLVAFAVLLISICLLIRKQLRESAPIRSLAVLPLQNLSGDPNQEYFADGMTDELITELARIPELRVISRTSVMQEKSVRKTLPQIAGELHVDAVVEGSIVRSGDKVRITAQLIDARNDKHLWAQSFESQSGDIVALQDTIAHQIAFQTRLVLIPNAIQHRPSHDVSPGAYDAYLRGRYFFGKGDFSRSTGYFRQAIAIEPTYASAFAGLADALDAETTVNPVRLEDVMPQALAAAKHAIELDPENGEAYTALGSIETIYERNWPQAKKDLTRGIALSPSYSLAEMKYAVYLDAVGRPQEAVVHMRRALALDPLSFFLTRRLGATLYLARDYDAAIDQLRRATEMEPAQQKIVDNWISVTYEAKGMRDEAVEHDLIALSATLPHFDADALRSIYKQKGWTAYWRARLAVWHPYEEATCTTYEIAMNDLRLKDKDQAFQSFNNSIDRRCYRVVWLKTDPLLDLVRDDPRYLGLLKRLNLNTQ